MTDESLEELQEKMNASLAKIHAAIKTNSYLTEEGTVFKMPDFNDAEVFASHKTAIEAASAYFRKAKTYQHLTTYRFEEQTSED